MNITPTLARIDEETISRTGHRLHTISFAIDAKDSLAAARKDTERIRVAGK
jgi:predicted dinucleotide-utilizing enzyme